MSAVPSDTASLQAGGAERARDRTWLRRVLMIGGVGFFAVGALGAWLWSGRYVGTDDAYVHANKLMVSTDVSGLVKTVDVKEGQQVNAGDVLFTLDPQPFEIALENAEAALAATVQDVESTRAQYRAALAQIAAQQAQVNVNRATLRRYEALATQGAIAPLQIDNSRATLLSSQATLASLQQTAATTLARLGGRADMPAEQTPAWRKAKAQVAEARRQLDHTVVRAPFRGVVSEVDALQPGTLVISAMSAFSTTSAVGLIGDKLWIEANMKETDLTHLQRGAPVDVTIDTYPGCHWQGHLESLSAGSDSAFSVLPSENGGGNWVKVVQRIPARIVIDHEGCKVPLRTGMSAVVSMDTGQRRWQRLLRG